MDQHLLHHPMTDRGDKENLMPPAVSPDMNDSNRTMPKMSSFVIGSSDSQENDLPEHDHHPIRLERVCLHQGNHSQDSHCPLGEMSLVTLAEHCTQEINKYRHKEPSDERYGMEIFRRAIALGNHDAWATLQHQFTENVRSWFAHDTYREAALRYESEQDYVDHAFQRFWQATSDQALTFTSLAGVLRYLKLCLHCAIMDTLRLYARTHLETLPEPGQFNEPQVEDNYNESELWETISNLLVNEQERRVAYIHFYCNLKAREIMRYCPGEFSSDKEIYRIKRNIMERIMHNIDKLRWRLGDALT